MGLTQRCTPTDPYAYSVIARDPDKDMEFGGAMLAPTSAYRE